MTETTDSLKSIWVVVEQQGGALHEVGLELLSKAREMADTTAGQVTGLLLGHGLEHLTGILFDHGADQIILGDHPDLEPYRLLSHVSVLAHLCREHSPDALLMGATSRGVELAPRLAARLETGLSAHCIDLQVGQSGRLLQVVPGWGGGVLATIECPRHRPQMATVMPGVMKKKSRPGREGTVLRCPVGDRLDRSGPVMVDFKPRETRGVPLEKAEVVVAGGWGIGSEEGWHLLEELAEVLGGAVGATRPPVDAGWALEEQMIGQSGKFVKPRLYLGLGISGVMHHVVGMEESECVMAVNTDGKTALFQEADFAVVGDYREVVPALIKEIRKRRAGAAPSAGS